MVLGSSSWLGPQMLRQNPVISIAEIVAKICLCWLLVITKICGTSRAADIFSVTNVWGSRRQAGKCWIMRGTPWVQQKKSANGRRLRGLLWSWETGSTQFLKTSLLTQWRNWCCGPESCGDGECFFPDWSAASGWKLWASLPALGTVHSVCCPCDCGSHVVTRRGFG